MNTAPSAKKLLLVQWVDASGPPRGWEFAESAQPDTPTVRSVGWLAKETKDYLFLVPHIAHSVNGDQYAGHFTIPKRMVIKRRVLR